MQSFRSRLFIFLLSHRHWFRLQWQREKIDWDTSIEALRERVEKSSGMFGRLPSEIEIHPAPIDNPTAEFVKINDRNQDGLILYFHGGGYVMGSGRAHRSIVSKFVQGSRINALTFDYRLAPEHPFPAALDDATRVYRWLLGQGLDPYRIIFAGDSAGGGLCLAALLAIKEQNLPQPAAAVALSPWTDLACTGDSYRLIDPLVPEGSWQVYSHYYAGDQDKTHPLISPLYGDLAGLPPLFISAGQNENMLDDSTRFAEKAREAGVEVTLQVGEGMVHCYPALSPFFVEAKEAMAEICEFIRSHIDRPLPGVF